MARLNVLAETVKGLKANIHAVDNLSPVSRVAVYVKAGSRYEPDEAPGISHYMKASALLTTKNSSAFGIARYIERTGASFKVSLEREHIIYRVDCLRNNLGSVLHFIDDSLHRPEYRSWELVDIVQPRLKEEFARLKKNQLVVVNEALHKAAYRGGLAHSTIIPEHQIGAIKKHHLFDYLEKNFVLSRIAIVGLGVDEGDLRNIIDSDFSFNSSDYKGVSGASRYVGGEARIQAGFPKTMVNFVVEGCPITDTKGLAILEVIGCILGDVKQTYTKYGIGPAKSLSNLLQPMSPSFESSIVNINHSDTGLFGFCISGPNDRLKDATKRVIGHVRNVMSNLKEGDLVAAKKSAKVRSLIQSEDAGFVFNAIAQRHVAGVTGQSPLDHIDKLSLKDVQDLASKLLKKKPTLVSVGNPRFVPYLDEIDS